MPAITRLHPSILFAETAAAEAASGVRRCEVRPENKAEDRMDRRLKRYRNMKRMCVLALREKNLGGRERTFTRIVREEHGGAAWDTVRDHVDRDAVVVTDEHRATPI